MGKTDENEIIDLDLSATRKKRFRIDHNNDRILELNTSDLNILTRIDSTYEQLKILENEAMELTTVSSNEEASADEVATKLKAVDTKMKEYIDYIFDSNVSEVCIDGNGSMYDPFNGQLRYEHIMDALLELYDKNLKSEANQMKQRINTRTAKYTKKKAK
jgi:hypothetical protein